MGVTSARALIASSRITRAGAGTGIAQLATCSDGTSYYSPSQTGCRSMAASARELEKLILGRKLPHRDDPLIRW